MRDETVSRDAAAKSECCGGAESQETPREEEGCCGRKASNQEADSGCCGDDPTPTKLQSKTSTDTTPTKLQSKTSTDTKSKPGG